MRVLFTSTSGVGHVQPMLPLATGVRDSGHEVLFATAADACSWIRSAGVEAVEAGLPMRERMEEYVRRWPEAAAGVGEERADHMFPHLFGVVTAPAAFPALLSAARSWRPDLVVSDAADFAAPVVAAAVGVPQVTHSFGLAVPPGRVQAAGEHAHPLWDEVGLEPRPYGGCYDHLYLDIYPPSLQPDDLSHVGRIQRRRPESHTDADAPVSDLVADVLADPRPLVYVTFGTVFNVTPAFTEVVEALRRMPDVRALVTVGPGGDPAAFGPLPDHVSVTTYVSQALILDRCAAVVSHGGSGTMLGALTAAVPQVCVPQGADQFRNAGAVASAGAGLPLTGEVTADHVEAALRTALDDLTLRAAAARLQAEIAAMPSVPEVVGVLEELAAA